MRLDNKDMCNCGNNSAAAFYSTVALGRVLISDFCVFLICNNTAGIVGKDSGERNWALLFQVLTFQNTLRSGDDAHASEGRANWEQLLWGQSALTR